MKSKIEVRTFAVNKAVEVLGQGVPIRDVVEKAKEIEAYILGAADLPEVVAEASPVDLINGIASIANAATTPISTLNEQK